MCQSSSLRLRNSRPQATHFSAMGNLRFVVAPGLQVFRGPPVRRSMLDRWPERCGAVGKVLVVVVGAAQPVGLGRDGLVLDHGGAAVWYRPVVTMRHR